MLSPDVILVPKTLHFMKITMTSTKHSSFFWHNKLVRVNTYFSVNYQTNVILTIANNNAANLNKHWEVKSFLQVLFSIRILTFKDHLLLFCTFSCLQQISFGSQLSEYLLRKAEALLKSQFVEVARKKTVELRTIPWGLQRHLQSCIPRWGGSGMHYIVQWGQQVSVTSKYWHANTHCVSQLTRKEYTV